VRIPLAIAGVVVREMYRRKDFYVIFVLIAVITLLLGSVSFFNDRQVIRYLKDACLLLIWLAGLVMAITSAARQIPSEIEARTIFPLLAKPVSRLDVLVGKFLGCWAACGLGLLAFYLFLAFFTAFREHHWPSAGIWQAFWLQWCMLGLVIAMTLAGSVIFAAPSSTSTIVFLAVLGILLLGRHLNKVALRSDEPARSILYLLYFSIPHLEFFDLREMVVHEGSVGWLPCSGATAYAMVYIAIFLLIGWLRFRSKPLL